MSEPQLEAADAHRVDCVRGGCRCGAVRYALDADRLPLTYACHCLDCQTWSGSAFSQQAIVGEAAFSVTGRVAQFDLPSADGLRISHQFACPVCFTRVFNTNSARPGRVAIRAGTFDASNELKLVAHIWTKRKQSWVVVYAATFSSMEGAPAGVLDRLLAGPR